MTTVEPRSLRLPEVDKEELKYKPYLPSELFTKDLDNLIESWMGQYSNHITRFTVASVLQEKILRLERDEHQRRKEQKESQ